MALDRNTYPYYDDYDIDKNFLEILFRPGRAVQSRELTQIQSILQNQIERFGRHIFKEGSMVIPGASSLDTAYPYIKLQPQYSAVDIDVTDFDNKKIVGVTSGTIATVLETVAVNGLDPDTLYIKIDSGASTSSMTGNITTASAIITNISVNTSAFVLGATISGTGIPSGSFIIEIISSSSVRLNNAASATTTGVTLSATTGATFVDGEVITTIETSYLTTSVNATAITSAATGFGSRVQIQDGIYFVHGYFCLVSAQSLILDKYTNTPSYKVGLQIDDSFVTSDEDISLHDPAQGSYNFNAPGANRYKIVLTLSKVATAVATDADFVEIMRVSQGIIQSLTVAADYSELEKTLARRTYDESGDYTVRYFPMKVREHLDDGAGNGGVYTLANGGDETKLVLAVEPGKAYVKGYEIETYSTNNIVIDKSRILSSVTNVSQNFNIGNYVNVYHKKGLFDITSNQSVNLYSAISTGGSILGTAKIRGQEFITGTPGQYSAEYRLYIYDVVMSGSNLFSSVLSIGTSATEYGDIILESGTAVLHSAEQNNAIIPLNEYAISTVDAISYATRRYFTGAMSSTSLTISVASGELFDASSVVNYQVSIVTASGTATGNGFANGDNINMNASGNSIVIGGSPTGKQAVLTIPLIAGSTIEVIATVLKTNIGLKTKTLTSRTETLSHSNTIQLDKADIYEIVSIVDATTSIDITNQYTLDNGQRDNYYDRGTLAFNPFYAMPAGNVVITYNYFDHSVGDYFSVDSYASVIDYKDIQHFTSSTGTAYDLINCLDFRPRINDSGSGYSVLSELPIPLTALVLDYTFYLSRKDKLLLNPDGSFVVLSGSSGITPTPPKEPVDSMVLYNITVPPYTFSVKDVSFELVDNKRYTMRDIGKLETRINNLEYYTSLSLLEKATADTFIDDGTGTNRFKNGFIVDNFSTYNVGDVTSEDYLCAIDTKNGILRPQFTKENVGLSVLVSGSSNYTKTGDLITLPFTTVNAISQPYASVSEYINPYNVYNWVGSTTMSPASDDWYDTNKTPDIIITNDSSFNTSLASESGNVIWNDWLTNWIGESTVPASTTLTKGSSTALGIVKTYGRLPNDNIGVYRDIASTTVGNTTSGNQNFASNTSITNQTIDEKIVDKSSIPYMRSKVISFTCKGLKPNTTVYPFFDDVLVSSYTTPAALVTDKYGEVSGVFTIPATATQRFRTGSKVFRLIDNNTNNLATATTSADAIYSATGTLNTIQDTILSTRTPHMVINSVSEDRTNVTSKIVNYKYAQNWVDPISQTFVVNKTGGMFLSKIDLYFATKDATDIPVTLQLRNVVNGAPAKNIIPFSEVSVKPASVNTSTTGVTATTFTFDSPVYLQDGQEYAFVLISNSNAYSVYCGKLGELDLITGSRISSQPYAGTMFKSQNANLNWTADLEQDIKFDIHRCVFSTAVTGSVLFENDALTSALLPIDPISTSNGQDSIIVNHPNHNLVVAQTTTLSGFVGTQNGIAAADLNGTHAIASVIDGDTYTIDLGSGVSATASGSCGGATMYATRNCIIDVTNINTQNMVFNDTVLGWGLKTILSGETVRETSFNGISLSNNLEFYDPRIVYSTENQSSASYKSLQLQATMTTTNDSVSPVIDTQRASATIIGNRITKILDSNGIARSETYESGGQAVAKYVTKKVVLTEGATGIKVFLSAIRPNPAEIQVFIKHLASQSDVIFDTLLWEHVAAVDYPAFDSTSLKDYTFEIQGLVPFNNFAIKIVLMSSDSSEVPLVKNFRVIATS